MFTANFLTYCLHTRRINSMPRAPDAMQTQKQGYEFGHTTALNVHISSLTKIYTLTQYIQRTLMWTYRCSPSICKHNLRHTPEATHSPELHPDTACIQSSYSMGERQRVCMSRSLRLCSCLNVRLCMCACACE